MVGMTYLQSNSTSGAMSADIGSAGSVRNRIAHAKPYCKEVQRLGLR